MPWFRAASWSSSRLIPSTRSAYCDRLPRRQGQLGVCLLDLADPSKLIGLAPEAILEPEEPYELVGQTPSVVFTSGAVVEPDGEVKVYYGGADTVQCVATGRVDALVRACLR